MTPTPFKSSQIITPLRTPQSKHRNTIKHTQLSSNPNSALKENVPPEHPVEVTIRIRDYLDQKEKLISALHVSFYPHMIRVRTVIGYRYFSLDGVFVSKEGDLEGFYKKFVESRINGVKLGEKCTAIIYDRTGSGNSHTMFGRPKQPGIVYKALRDILRLDTIPTKIEYPVIFVNPINNAPPVLITPMTNSPPSHKNDDKCNIKSLEARVQPNLLKDEVYSGVEAIKYLQSYIFKGHEKTQLCDEIAIKNFIENSKNRVTRSYEDKTQSNVTKLEYFMGRKL
ncbi:hypothetical protein GIB67_013914 [Kingdonia uniflora]|uniref:Kinesin motor domain-containing protein n=1 Tax=Kingdonia uniflora TaxID=39325 RepID=A0A7J7LD64_9MAGN|nr:hypothetical protein GIB67_013914 [Kingdonia uniflora]